MGQSLKGMYGIVLQKRKISQTFSIRLLAIRTKICYGLISKENVAKKFRQLQNDKWACKYCPFTIV